MKWLLVGMLAMMAMESASAGVVTYVYTDPQGTPLAEADINGNVMATFDYRPYGVQALGAASSGPGYTGHMNDLEAGLVYMQARYYDSEVGRFMSQDPVPRYGGNELNFNRFSYAGNNPVAMIDPTGMFPKNMNSDDFECEVFRCSRFVSGDGNGGGGVYRGESAKIPAGTPKSMESHFQSADVMSRMKAALAVMDYYNIDHHDINCCMYITWPGYNAAINPNGDLAIGVELFNKSFGLIGAILSHEVEGHWNMQYKHMAIFDGMYTQAWFMREVQAYDYELSKRNVLRFGLTPDEVKEQQTHREFNFNHLSPANKKLVGQGIYVPF